MTENPSNDSVLLRSMFSPSIMPADMSPSDEQQKKNPISSAQRTGPTLGGAYPADIIRKFHQHNLSDSTDSSPTTTVSTVDDSSGTEPSPTSSPESPPSTTGFSHAMHRPRTSAGDGRPFFELQKQPPPRKGRNLKNLAVNTSRQSARPATSDSRPAALNATDVSNGGTTTFVKPPTPSKRKTNQLGLTLLTPGSSKFAPQDMTIAIPPTPSLGRPGLLRHFQSSPSLPLVSVMGSQHDLISQNHHMQPTLETIMSPVEAAPPLSLPSEEEEQNFEIPLSREAKPEAYPDGPICVYEPSIDLYLEPTAEQARQYDVIMNVAAEVRNPFLTNGEVVPEDDEIRIDGGGGIQYAPKRDRVGVQTISIEKSDDSSPSTPRATPLSGTFFSGGKSTNATRPDPEYMHIKWEHNSDIVPDLLRLCKVIDERVAAGSRILVHCQCGVSRSASLVVAYGLYKQPTQSVQEAYDAVKKRSKWIGPNMNLIMQLQEFRTSLMRGGVLADDRGLSPMGPSSAISEWSPYPFSEQQQRASAGTATAADGTLSPLPTSLSASATTPGLTKSQTNSETSLMSPGPSSAPSGLPWVLADAANHNARSRAISTVNRGSAYVNPSGKIVPVVSLLQATGGEPQSTISLATAIAGNFAAAPHRPQELRIDADTFDEEADAEAATPTGNTPLSPRSDQFAMAPLQPSPEVQSADQFGLMSPTSTEFTANPFDRSTLLASLGMGSMMAPTTAGGESDSPRRSISLRHSRVDLADGGAAQAGVSRNNSNPTKSYRTTNSVGSQGQPTIRQQHQQPQQQAQPEQSSETPRRRLLRPKLSSPTLREQQQLQDLEAKVQAERASQRTHLNPPSYPTATINNLPLRRPVTSAATPAWSSFNSFNALNDDRGEEMPMSPGFGPGPMGFDFGFSSAAVEPTANANFGVTAGGAASDDDFEDALMSPRATEFTRNPFALALGVSSDEDDRVEAGNDAQQNGHAGLQASSTAGARYDSVSTDAAAGPQETRSSSNDGQGLPLSKNATSGGAERDGANGHLLPSGQNPNAKPVRMDPRSPAQQGSAPITRNIFDVL